MPDKTPGLTAEPILDIVRGISTVFSAFLIKDTITRTWEKLFTSECAQCRGTGIMTCPYCHGTKALRKRPGVFMLRSLRAHDPVDSRQTCVFCGDLSVWDGAEEMDDNDNEAMDLFENLNAAMAGKKLPHPRKPLAGTVECNACGGFPVIQRHTPDILGAFKMGWPWDFEIAQRWGGTTMDFEEKPRGWNRKYLEYPSREIAHHVPMLAEMEERVQGYPGPYVSDSDDEDQEEKQPAKSAEQEDMEEDLEDGLAPKPNTLEYLFDESDNTEWIVDDVKDQYLLEQEQDKSDSSDTDEQDEED
eukprot:jgi/Astpho2/242/Aster-x0430